MIGTPSILANLLADCDAHGIRLALADSGGLEIDAPQDALTPDRLAQLKAHKAELLAILRAAPKAAPVDQADAAVVPSGSVDAPDDPGPAVDYFPSEPADETERVAQRLRPNNNARVGAWPADVAAAADFTLLLTPDDLPSKAFEFGGPHRIVVDAEKFLRWLQADARHGPTGPRAMYGAIQDDLRRLRRMLATTTGHKGQYSL